MSNGINSDGGVHLPRAVPIEDAAQYVGCSSVWQFRREIRQGIWPGPITLNSRPQRWSIPQLELALKGRDDQDGAIAAAQRRFDKRFEHG